MIKSDSTCKMLDELLGFQSAAIVVVVIIIIPLSSSNRSPIQKDLVFLWVWIKYLAFWHYNIPVCEVVVNLAQPLAKQALNNTM